VRHDTQFLAILFTGPSPTFPLHPSSAPLVALIYSQVLFIIIQKILIDKHKFNLIADSFQVYITTQV
jgi:hypothetical protein